jgi:hypothetical protein
MLATQGYVVVSCHVERPLDDRVWRRYVRLLRSRPGGLRIASLLRPPGEGEDAARWIERAHEAAALGPLGHHTHWTAPDHARPTAGGAGERVLQEGRWLADSGVEPRFFCGGGWYFDPEVAAAIAELGYHDCTGTAFRPAYLPAGAPRLAVAAPARLRLPDGRLLLELPTTHSIGAGLRTLPRRAAGPRVLHLYFHDTDLLDGRRRAALRLLLLLLPRLRHPTDLDELAAAEAAAPELRLEDCLG